METSINISGLKENITIKELNEIEQQLRSLNKARLKSKDKQFILDSYAYEEILNEELRQIKEKGLSNNKRVRETTQTDKDKDFFKSLGVAYYE